MPLKKSLWELKYSDNPQWKHGLEKQLPQYMISEQAKYGYYVVLDVGSFNRDKMQTLEDIRAELKQQCEICYIDAGKKNSASKK